MVKFNIFKPWETLKKKKTWEDFVSGSKLRQTVQKFVLPSIRKIERQKEVFSLEQLRSTSRFFENLPEMFKSKNLTDLTDSVRTSLNERVNNELRLVDKRKEDVLEAARSSLRKVEQKQQLLSGLDIAAGKTQPQVGSRDIDFLQKNLKELPYEERSRVIEDILKRRERGEKVYGQDIGRITWNTSPEIRVDIDKFFEEMGTQDEELSSFARESFFSVGKRKDADTPGKKAIDLVYHRAGNIMYDTNKSIYQALTTAYEETQEEVEQLEIEEQNRLFIEKLKENRKGWDTNEEEKEAFKRVIDIWLPALGVEDTEELSAYERTKLLDKLIEPEGVRGFKGGSVRALIKTLDEINPEDIPPEERETFIKNITDAIHSESGLKIKGAFGTEITIDESTLIFGAIFPKFTAGMLVGEWLMRPVGLKAGEQFDQPILGEEIAGFVGGMAGGVLGPAAVSRIANAGRNAAMRGVVQPGFVALPTKPPIKPVPIGKPITPVKNESANKALEAIEYLKGKGKPLKVVTAEEKAAEKTLSIRTTAAEKAYTTYENLQGINERFLTAQSRLLGLALRGTGRPKVLTRQEIVNLRASAEVKFRPGNKVTSINPKTGEKVTGTLDHFAKATDRAFIKPVTGEAPIAVDVINMRHSFAPLPKRFAQAFPTPAQVTKGALKELENIQRQIVRTEATIMRHEQAMRTFIVAPESKRFGLAIRELTKATKNGKRWDEIIAGLPEGTSQAMAEVLEGLPRTSIETMRTAVEAANTAPKLGWAIARSPKPIRSVLRAILGHDVYVDDIPKLEKITGAAVAREAIVSELVPSRSRSWLMATKEMWKETGLAGKEAELYFGPVRPDFPHSIASVISRPELYKLTPEQLRTVKLIQQSINENLALTERLFGVDTKMLSELFARQAEEAGGIRATAEELSGRFGASDIPSGFMLTEEFGYWPQYLDRAAFEILTGLQVKGVPRGAVGLRQAFEKARKYKDVFDVWDNFRIKGQPAKLLDPWESMSRRWAASGRAIGDAQYRQALINNLPNSTKQSMRYSSGMVPGAPGRYFEPDIAAALRKQGDVLSNRIPGRTLRTIANFVRSMKLSGDFSGGGAIQGFFNLANMSTQPAFLAKQVIPMARMVINPKYFDKWYAANLPKIMRMQSKGLKVASSPVDIMRITRGELITPKNIYKLPARVMDILNDANFGRMVTFYKITNAEHFLDIMRYARGIPEFRSFAERIPGVNGMLSKMKGIEGMSDDAIERVVYESINNRFGGISQAMTGKGPWRVLAEQLLDIAPNWLRARTSVYINAFKGKGPERYLALNMIGRELFLGAILSTVFSHLLTGELPNLTDPRKFDWLGIKTPIGTIPTIPSVSIMRLIIREAALLGGATYNIGKGDDPTDTLLGLKTDTWDTFKRGLRGRESPVLSELITQYEGKDFFGSPVETLEERSRSMALAMVPIFIEDTVEAIERGAPIPEVAAVSTVAFGGASVYPPSIFQLAAEAKNRGAQELFAYKEDGTVLYGEGVIYADLSDAEKADVRELDYVVEAQERADAKAEELELESAWLNQAKDKEKSSVDELKETGSVTLSDGTTQKFFNTTQKEDNQFFGFDSSGNLTGFGEIDGDQWRDRRRFRDNGIYLAGQFLRIGQERPAYDPKEPTNPIDKEIDAYWEIKMEDFLDPTGEPDFAAFYDAQDAQYKKALKAGYDHDEDRGRGLVAKLLRPTEEDPVEKIFKETSKTNRDFGELLKYRFIETKEQEVMVDKILEAVKMATATAREQGVRNVPTHKELLGRILANLDRENPLYVPVGIAFLRKTEFSELVWNPERDQMVLDNPMLVKFYPNSYFFDNLSDTNKIRFMNEHGTKYFSQRYMEEEKIEPQAPARISEQFETTLEEYRPTLPETEDRELEIEKLFNKAIRAGGLSNETIESIQTESKKQTKKEEWFKRVIVATYLIQKKNWTEDKAYKFVSEG